MSDVTTGKGFDSEFLTHPPRWFGRIEESQTWRDNHECSLFDQLPEIKGWGYRYKVRIFSWHTGDVNIVPPDQMVMANVIMPVTAGSGLGGYAETPSLSAGCIVTGFFMDGMGGQEPYIDGVLGNSTNNVPKKRGGPTTTPNPIPSGSTAENLDNLNSGQLNNLLNPARSPTRQEFAAATAAREAAKAAGLPKDEIERLVKIATVKASQPTQSPPRETKEKQTTLGYQLYDTTFNDPNIAKIPDFRTVSKLNLGNVAGESKFPLFTFDSLHFDPVKSHIMHDDDKKIPRPLMGASKKKNSEIKGIQRVVKNLINYVEQLKKYAGETTAFANSIKSKVQSAIDDAASHISGYMSSIMDNIMSYVQNKIADGAKIVNGYLFPGEVPEFSKILENQLEKVNNLFQNISRGLKNTFKNLLKNLLDKSLNTPLCAAEKLVSDFLGGGIIDKIGKIVDLSIKTIQEYVGKISIPESNVFNSLDFMTGILEYFSGDEEMSSSDYSELSLIGPAVPGGDPPPPIPGGIKSPSDGIKTIVGSLQNTSEGLGEGKAETQPQSNISVKSNSTSSLSIISPVQDRDDIKKALDLY